MFKLFFGGKRPAGPGNVPFYQNVTSIEVIRERE